MLATGDYWQGKFPIECQGIMNARGQGGITSNPDTYEAFLTRSHGLSGSANTAQLSDQLHHRARVISCTELPHKLSISMRNGVVPIWNNAISPRGVMTKIKLGFPMRDPKCKSKLVFHVHLLSRIFAEQAIGTGSPPSHPPSARRWWLTRQTTHQLSYPAKGRRGLRGGRATRVDQHPIRRGMQTTR
jgi:hypothetical protein